MQCTACGTDVPADSSFCPKCGAKIGEDAAAGKRVAPTPAERFRESAPGGNDTADEEVDLWKGGYSGKDMVGSWLLAAIASVGLIVVGVILPPPSFPLVIVAIVLLWAILGAMLACRKLSVKYELSTQRFVHKTGILKRVTDRIEVIDIDDVTFEQGLVQRMVNVGTIKISSSDRTHPELTLRGIEGVQEVADTIDDVRRKERRRRGLHIEAI
jgi:membrane protein YdbS with pleckstrin-like domain